MTQPDEENTRVSGALLPGPRIEGHRVQRDEEQKAYVIDETLITCTPTEYRVLTLLLEQADRCVPFAQLWTPFQDGPLTDATQRKQARIRIIHLMSDLRAIVKIAANFLIAVSLEAMGQAAALVEGYGFDRARFLRMLVESPLFRGNVFEGYSEMIGARDFTDARFPVDLGLKDVELAKRASGHIGVDLPYLEALLEHLGAARRAGREAEDPLPAIDIRDLCKNFGRTPAVSHLTLCIEQGEIFGLLGPNGSGKTTTINLISGLSSPTSGQVRILGYDVRRQTRQVHRLLGTVPQETALYEELSALQNMQYHAALYGVPRKERAERIRSMLALVHLLDRQHARVGTFSGGMKRRLALARALLHEPSVLYLDEPTLGVDPQNRHALYAFLRALPAQGVTVLLTTNDMHEAQQLCTRVAIIDHGELQIVDTPQRLQQHAGPCQIDLDLDADAGQEAVVQAVRTLPGVASVEAHEGRLMITSDDQAVLPAILALIGEHGCSVCGLSLRAGQLEDAFLRMTGSLLRD